MNEDLLNALFQANSYTTFFRENSLSISKGVESRVRSLYRDDVDNSKVTTQYKYRNNKLDYFYHYWVDEDIGKKIITTEFLIPPKWSLDKVKKLINEVSGKDRRIKTSHFYVPVNSLIYRQLIELGAVNNGYHLFGVVEEGLRYLSQYCYDSTVKVSSLNKRDFHEVIELEYFAQKYSKTSRCGILPRREIEALFSHLMKNKRKVIIAKEKGRILGVIAPSVNDFKVGHIMTISVHPDDQKRGVSKLLYFEALKYLKSQRVKIYSGVSTTTEVLGLARKMKRKPRYAYLEIKRD